MLRQLLLLILSCAVQTDEPLRIPGRCAYIEPRPQGASISAEGISNWSNPRDRVVWFGLVTHPGDLTVSVELAPTPTRATLRLAVGEQSQTLKLDPNASRADFGTFKIEKPGYVCLQLEGLSKSGKTFPGIQNLVLSGAATKDSFFSTSEHRGCASVHLWFPPPQGTKVAGFYNEVTARTDPIWTYYEACGWHRGYFGMQVNSPTERRIIFSVWDSGNEPADRSKVKDEDRVRLIAKGPGVVTNDFGNEGTGGHSHLVYDWKTGEPQRFFVTAEPDGDATIYTGWFFFPERKKWGLIASFRAPKDGSYMRGLYAFNENFGGDNGQLLRLAEFGNQWVRTPDGQWIELTRASFSHTGDIAKDRRDFSAGVRDCRFFLSTGGFRDDPPSKYGDVFDRPATGKPPSDIVLGPK
jgi:hypothetical protein